MDPEAYAGDEEVVAKAEAMGKPGLVSIVQKQVGLCDLLGDYEKSQEIAGVRSASAAMGHASDAMGKPGLVSSVQIWASAQVCVMHGLSCTTHGQARPSQHSAGSNIISPRVKS